MQMFKALTMGKPELTGRLSQSTRSTQS